jgi:Arc/MetJ family transcription regulator
MYMMRRTQVYFEEDLWTLLRSLAREQKTSVSDLVRRAVRERYVRNREEGKKAMLPIVGIWADRKDIRDTDTYVRNIRRGKRIETLHVTG